MNPGPVEEGGKIAIGVIDALKAQPAFLVVILFMSLVLLLVYWANAANTAQRNEMMRIMLDNQHATAEMLSKCVVPNKGSQ